jgi:hypothetical protein
MTHLKIVTPSVKSLFAAAFVAVLSTVAGFGQTASFSTQPFADAFVTTGATGS